MVRIGSDYIKLDQTGSNSIKIDQSGINWKKYEQIESNWIKLDQIQQYPQLVEFVVPQQLGQIFSFYC